MTDTLTYCFGPPDGVTMQRVGFHHLGNPVAMARPRVTRYGTYTPKNAKLAMEAIYRTALSAKGQRAPFQGPVAVRMQFILLPPKSLPKKVWGSALPMRRPDLDNYIKLVLDGCKCLWRDDAQVIWVSANKEYAWGGQAMTRFDAEAVSEDHPELTPLILED